MVEADFPREDDLEMLNIYEVEIDGRIRHLVCFIDPKLAGVEGIAPKKIIGEFQPDADGEFDPDTFVPNPEFARAYTSYMNTEVAHTPELMLMAQDKPGQSLSLVDPRDPGNDPAPVNIVGKYKIDPEGWIEHHSFKHNPTHKWFDPNFGVSGVLSNREFYDWLNAPEPES